MDRKGLVKVTKISVIISIALIALGSILLGAGIIPAFHPSSADTLASGLQTFDASSLEADPLLLSASTGGGAIWTTRNDCGDQTQDVNHFDIGEIVFINGDNFEPADYDWSITGRPGGASCDPNIAVASGVFTVVGNDGNFCFAAYTIQPDDCGEYQVKFDTKGDNYRVEPLCGNGILDEGEQCDDGNTVSGDGCNSQCQLEFCGDNVVQPSLGEECDDGNNLNDDGCSSVCKIEFCGDGVKQSSEQCDDGNNVSGDGCSSACVIEFCGDNIVQPPEQCDDGNNVSGDGCNSVCRIEFCGDGIKQPNEQCDDGNTVNGDGCSATCVLEFCGDGIVQPPEQCDDGNNLDGDGCDSVCRIEFCGDGIKQPNEQCDDGNQNNNDTCTNSCTLTFCGDGSINRDEACDDGNNVSGDGCSAVCELEFCGDNIVQPPEQCDDGNNLNGDGCDSQCRVEFCGDNILQPSEQCDDGNTVSGDGCSDACLLEFCGDGFVQLLLGEECDDGNSLDNDGCSSVCKIELCGDGIKQSGEQCDDGNTVNGDGCSAACVLEFCGDGIIQPPEECDDGNNIDTDECTNSCKLTFCGDTVIQPPEGCELPGTGDNSFCPQTTETCKEPKKGTRDGFGLCDLACGCVEDPFVFTCVEGECGAVCDSENDFSLVDGICNYGCDLGESCAFENSCSTTPFCGGPDNNTYFFEGQCSGAGCSFTELDCDDLDFILNVDNFCDGSQIKSHREFHDFSCGEGGCKETVTFVDVNVVQDCDLLDGWYDTGNTRFVENDQCTEKEQKEQEFRDYTCGAGPECVYVVSDTRWVDTGNMRNKADGTVCEDGLFCTVGDVCTEGVCGGEPRACAGNQCNIGICDEVSDACVFDPLPLSTSCEADGDLCTIDHCDGAGACVNLDKVTCPGPGICEDSNTCNPLTGSCEIDYSDNGTVCNNGVFCDGGEACNGAGSCINTGPPVDCSGFGDQCNVGVCNEERDICEASPLPLSTVCDDGLFCDGEDHCDGSGACVSLGSPVVCGDENICTSDFCDEELDECVFKPLEEEDNVTPQTNKTYGEPFFSNGTSEWINSSTLITLNATDNEFICPAGLFGTFYRTTLVGDINCLNNEVCQETNGSGGWNFYTGPFSIGEESCHLIEFFSNDTAGNMEKVNKQCVFVDNSAPEPNKTVSEPKEQWDGQDAQFYDIADKCWASENGIECWKVTTLTQVKLDCSDPEPHPVNHEQVCFNVNFDGEDITGKYCEGFESGEMQNGFCCVLGQEAPVAIHFTEESEHNLQFYCVDKLGNKGPIDEEKFKVEGDNFEIWINKKWNLISVPFVLLNSSPELVFEDVAEEVKAVWTYEGNTWFVFTPDGIENDNLESIQPGAGYWVLANNMTMLTIGGTLFSPVITPPSKEIGAGWNLIGYYGNEDGDGNPILVYHGPDGNGKQAICSLGSLVDTVFGHPKWNSLLTYWEPFNPDPWVELGFFDNMDPGAGYWLEIDKDESYSFSTTCPIIG